MIFTFEATEKSIIINYFISGKIIQLISPSVLSYCNRTRNSDRREMRGFIKSNLIQPQQGQQFSFCVELAVLSLEVKIQD